MNRVTNTSRHTQGFTLIELVLAMSFISILLITIATTVIQMSATFSKGMALKEVNQTARELDADLTRTFAASEPVSLTSGNGQYYVNDAGGRLCLGTFSYIWNTEEALSGGEGKERVVKYASGAGADPSKRPNVKIRFLKVPDGNRYYCSVDGGAPVASVVTVEDAKVATELIEAGDRKLGIQRFTVSSLSSASDTATGQRLYSVGYVIGSGNVSAMNDTRTACLTTGEGADPAYCHVRDFNLVIRTGLGG
jgi:hypothetical protein